MKNILIPFLLGISVGTWVYSRMYRKTGGNNNSSLIVAGVSGFLIFFVLWLTTVVFLH